MPRLAARSVRAVDVATELWFRDSAGWFFIASLAFSAAVMHLVFNADLTSGQISNAFLWLLAVYMSYVAIWTVRLVRRMRVSSFRAIRPDRSRRTRR